MIILAYGIKQPTAGDSGAVFFPALEELCQRMASHKHDDIDSHPVASASVTLQTVKAAKEDWVSVSTGVYYQNITLPTGYTTLKCLYEVRDFTSDEVVYPTIKKLSATQIRVETSNVNADYRIYFK